jgi:hypothetical protein
MKNFTKVTWISGMPRSGTTWLSQIFASSPDVRLKFCPLFSYEFKNALDENSTEAEWKDLFYKVYNTKSEYLDQEYLKKQGLVPTFDKKNLAPNHLVIKSTRFHNLTPSILKKDNSIKFLFLVRNPCATIYSWLTNPYEFPKDAIPENEWRTGRCRKNAPGEFWGFNDWKNVVLQALELKELYPERFFILRYEELTENSEKCIKEIFSSLGILYEKQTSNFLLQSQSKHDGNKRSVYKKPSLKASWESGLSPDIIENCLKETKGTELEQFTKI